MSLALSAVAVAGQVREEYDNDMVDPARMLELRQTELHQLGLEEDRSRQAEGNVEGRNPAVADKGRVGTAEREWLFRVSEAMGYQQTLDWDEMDVENGDSETPADTLDQ